jgi:hypothetical protein
MKYARNDSGVFIAVVIEWYREYPGPPLWTFQWRFFCLLSLPRLAVICQLGYGRTRSTRAVRSLRDGP